MGDRDYESMSMAHSARDRPVSVSTTISAAASSATAPPSYTLTTTATATATTTASPTPSSAFLMVPPQHAPLSARSCSPSNRSLRSDGHAGYLWKKTSFSLRSWQKRWFVIENDLLHYYKKRPEDKGSRRERNYLHLLLPLVEIVRLPDELSFQIRSCGKIIIELKSKDKDEIESWIRAIEEAQNKSNKHDLENATGQTTNAPLPTMSNSSAAPSEAVKFLQVQQRLDSCVALEQQLQQSVQRLSQALDALSLTDRKEKDKKKKKKSSLEAAEEERILAILHETESLRTISSEMHKTLSTSFHIMLEMEETIVKGLNATAEPEQEGSDNKVTQTGNAPVLADGRLLRSISARTETGTEGYYDANTHISLSGSDDSGTDTSESEPDDSYDDSSPNAGKKHLEKPNSKSARSLPLNSPRKASAGRNNTLALIKGSCVSANARLKLPVESKEPSQPILSFLLAHKDQDLTRISLPIDVNEPLSLLQNMCEDAEYSLLLQQAARCTASWQRMVYIAAFAISCLPATVHRGARKPFKPILGETFEYVASDGSFRFLAEHVQHNPPLSVCYASGSGWSYYREVTVRNKLNEESIDVNQHGIHRVHIPSHQEIYTWNKITSNISRSPQGNPWVQYNGELLIRNESTGETCQITIKPDHEPNSPKRAFHGIVASTSLASRPQLRGKWDSCMEVLVGDGHWERIWEATPIQSSWERQFGFTNYAISLNDLTAEMESLIPPTDSRLRKDIRFLERGDLEAAASEKHRLEEESRALRKSKATAFQPKWFQESRTQGARFEWNQSYWEVREKCKFGEFSRSFS